ncbi:GNAT family N-acetyltransferase [Lentimicrobium sp. L6]|uniref:GNAT family N-acetyltransferase n=1 Tax=Lentimicrobium sp. L6 TaxID=2735916 RepID=UPI00155734CA|nr:GNAT family N-acetyltransferase [Lentimicrobium sp. L6]NPD83524.1 GNAT family N-acetyltransferase [Lentimicrobium sp. L6]
MSLEIKAVKTRAELKKFVRFYTELYKNNQQVAIPLHMDELATLSSKNPAMEHCEMQLFLAIEDGKIVGRIACIVNKHECEKEKQQVGRFGWFDFVDKPEVSEALMATAIDWFQKRNIIKVHGPFGFTDLDRQGMLIEGFEEVSTFATIYNYKYYQQHIESLGFKKQTDWLEYKIFAKGGSFERVQKISDFVAHKYQLNEVKLHSKRDLKRYISKVFQLLNICYQDLYGYVALTEKQMKHYADMFLFLVKLDFLSLIENKDGELIGFGIAMPSFSQATQKAKGKIAPLGWYHLIKAMKKNDTLDLYLLAVLPEYQNKGVNAMIMSKIMNSALKFGIEQAESNIELEDNKKVQQMWRLFEHEQHKRRRCYYKNLVS